MGLLVIIGGALLSLIAVLINTLLNVFMPKQKPKYPPIRNKLLTKSAGELIVEIRTRKLTSEELVTAYIERIKEVNPTLNAIIEDRFEDALKEAKHADQLVAKSSNEQLLALTARYPLLGIPFTVKEACGVKGMSFTVGSIDRMQTRCSQDGEVVELLRAAGAIPLLVSATPEFCLSFETNTQTHGRCRNPYDLSRTSAGSSGGEGALNGAGATLFGVASDIAGSIRLPAMFCGVFGHKPTSGLLSVKGHFPNTTKDPNFAKYLQLGPITRFARDLPVLLQVMAGKNASKLKFDEGVKFKELKIYYAYGFHGLNSLRHPPVAFDIKLAITRAVEYFKKGGLPAKEVKIQGFNHSLDIALSGLLNIKGIPSVLTQTDRVKPARKVILFELVRSLFGHSLYTKEALIVEFMQNSNLLFTEEEKRKWSGEVENVRQELIDLLGTNGVLFFPTFHTSALCFHTSILNLTGIDMMLLFNVLGFPSTSVPMGLDHRGMPVGFQVIAAPYQDKLCLEVAMALENGFGGWEPPLRHDFIKL